ncbi:MAG: single-stranded DNA-binding protein [Candidatus Verstraetearchaeota archaeon]|nr:single-stranded DNA-binding protein [Candidatus Verstraetearchaeota archaeon]
MPEEKKIEELNPASRSVDVTARVLEINQVREVFGRDGRHHRVAEALIGDETGTILLTLWDDNIDRITPGKTIVVRNGYITLFRGHMRLNVGRHGIIEDSESEVAEEEINTENNLSDRSYNQSIPRFKPLFRERGWKSRGRSRRR